MSKKQNKQNAQNKAKREYDKHMEEHLFKTLFPLECESIPIEELPLEEQELIQKCRKQEDLTEEEKTKVKSILNDYRESIHKIKPQETLENVEKTIQVINSEKELLDILDNPNRRFLLVHLPLDGKIYEMDFEVLPINDSRAIESIQMQMDIFKDYSQEEREIYAKAQNKKQRLTPQEQRIVDKVTKEINEKASEQQEEMIISLLANQLKLPNSTDDIELRKEFWTKFPFNAKMSVWIQIRNRLGLTEEDNEALFPTR